VASAYGWVTIVILSMVKRAHPLYSNKKIRRRKERSMEGDKYDREWTMTLQGSP
jgi:hypothetical protein